MITTMEIKQHLCRMLPESGYTPDPLNWSRESKAFLKPGKIPTRIDITGSGYVVVCVEDRQTNRYIQVSRCRLSEVTIGKGYTMIASYMVEH